MRGSSPDRSPLAIRRKATGGNWPLSPSARENALPSRTRNAARFNASRIGRFVTTCAAIASASSKGTALPASRASVRVARAVFAARASRPTTGTRSSSA